MKEFLLIGTFPPPYGGVAIFNSLLCTNFKEKNLPYGCFCVNNVSSQGIFLPLEVGKYLKTLFTATGFGKILLDSANMFLEYPIGRESLYRGIGWWIHKIVKRHYWIKIIHDGSLPERYKEFTKWQKHIFIWLIRKTDSVIVVSPALERWLKQEIGYQRNIVRIGSLLPMHQKGRSDTPQNIIDFIKSYDKTVLTVGTCETAYGFEHLIEALKTVRASLLGLSIGLIAVDGGFAQTDRAYKEMQMQIASEENTLLISEGLPHEVMLEVMRRCDVYVRGSFFESYGISRIEALLCGTPVIATKTGQTKGMITYEFGDVEDLANKLLHLLSGEIPLDFYKWVDYYRAEAEKNYNIIVELLKEIK